MEDGNPKTNVLRIFVYALQALASEETLRISISEAAKNVKIPLDKIETKFIKLNNFGTGKEVIILVFPSHPQDQASYEAKQTLAEKIAQSVKKFTKQSVIMCHVHSFEIEGYWIKARIG